jgi:N-acetylmuramoyl-L-alanine amidase
VVVDAGHGGLDPGSLGKYSREKDLNLAVALLVGKMIGDSFPSVEVIYTRKKDIFVALEERTNIANKHNADLFISIHANSVRKNSSAKGSETFVMGTKRSADNMEVAKRENAVITYEEDYTSKYEGYDPNSSESFIMFSLMQNAHLDQSLQMAALVQEELGTYPIKVNRGVKQDLFLVLWRTAMPSILIEMGFVSNPEDEKILASKEGQAHIAKSIFRAFINYKIHYDRQLELSNNVVTVKAPVAEKTEPAVIKSEPTAVNSATGKPSYRVQIMASKTKLTVTSKEFKSFNDVKVIYFDNWYKYTTGNFDSLEEAQKYCIETVRKHIKDAFIICVENEKVVPLKK